MRFLAWYEMRIFIAIWGDISYLKPNFWIKWNVQCNLSKILVRSEFAFWSEFFKSKSIFSATNPKFIFCEAKSAFWIEIFDLNRFFPALWCAFFAWNFLSRAQFQVNISVSFEANILVLIERNLKWHFIFQEIFSRCICN